MNCSYLKEQSSLVGPERHGGSVPEANLISGDSVSKEKLLLKVDKLHNEDLSNNKPTYLTAFYLAHADEVNRTLILNLYTPSTQAQFAKVKVLWKQ
jgi:hypothetical protein